MDLKVICLLCSLAACSVAQNAGITIDFGAGSKDGRSHSNEPGFFDDRDHPPGCSAQDCGTPYERNQWDQFGRQMLDPANTGPTRKKRQVIFPPPPQSMDLCRDRVRRIWWFRFLWAGRWVWAYVWQSLPWVNCLNWNHYCNQHVYYNNYKYCCKEEYRVSTTIVVIRSPILRPFAPRCWNNRWCFIRLHVRFPACCKCKACKFCPLGPLPIGK